MLQLNSCEFKNKNKVESISTLKNIISFKHTKRLFITNSVT